MTTSHLYEQLDSAWQALHSLQEQYREYKEQADFEFQESQYWWSMHDGASAKEHSENGHILNARKAEIGSYLDGAHARFDSVKSQFDEAVDHQRGIKAELEQAKDAHKSRIGELKARNLQEQMHWKEKNCRRCGEAISYNDTWAHIPNYCKECKAKFSEERKSKVTKQGGLSSQGYKLRHNPNTGKNDFFFGSDNPKTNDGHGHVVIGDDGYFLL